MRATSVLFAMLLAVANGSPQHQVPMSPVRCNPRLSLCPPTAQSVQMRQDNTCGMQNGKVVKCTSLPGGGPCCSSYGFCGMGELYCGIGCQSEFGQCSVQIATHRQEHCGPKHKNKKCSAGECCSANGKCGRSQSFCGKHCQPAFGICHPEHAQTSTAKPEPAPTARPTRCGKDFGNQKCAEGDCCSDAGYCGKGNDFCSVPQSCQRAFGTCDSDAVPKGSDLSPAKVPRPRRGKVPYGQTVSKCSKPRTIALSFDDGPSNNTNKILDILSAHGAKATFFLSGNTMGKGMIDQTEVWIRTVKRIVAEGHQIGSHTWSHPHLDAMSHDERLTDMLRNDRAIANIIGKFPTYMRPPYLECSKQSGCLQDMTDLGYHVVAWDVDSHDWEEITTLDQMKTNFDKAAHQRGKDGNMFLIQHDHNKHSAELAEYVLGEARKLQWKAVTLGECLEDPVEFWYHDGVKSNKGNSLMHQPHMYLTLAMVIGVFLLV